MEHTEISGGLRHLASGKVREIYEVDDERLLIVATDRISAFDVVLDQPIPDKGKVLTGLTVHWLGVLDTPNHLISAEEVPEEVLGRAMLVRRAEVIPMECVVRGYLYGSAWKEYAAGGGPTTEHLPPGLRQASALPEPIFTPATKAESGHDENLTEIEARRLVGDATYEDLRKRSIALYLRGAELAAARGIILADTKFEFGRAGAEVILIDEVLTPDSSRYWPAEAWAPGTTIPSFDKQPVRDFLDEQAWDKTPPAPPLPKEVVEATRARYVEAYERLAGARFDDFSGAGRDSRLATGDSP